jgi:prepilin-type processing-associated H-X9-DG protein
MELGERSHTAYPLIHGYCLGIPTIRGGWWIRSPASDYSQGEPGFNRLLQNDYGCRRHAEKANYAFADGHVAKLDANDIPCNVNDCWWSIRPDVHRPNTAAGGP